MNHFFNKTILFISCFFISAVSYAQFQSTTVEKSEQKILYQGKTYYVHTIKQGQTLYSICKVYEVTQQEIASANPGVSLSPLSIGQALRIPVHTAGASAIQKPGEKTPDDENFYFHTLQANENIYFLHQKYNVPVETIYKYNPGSEGGVKMGEVIRIPKKKLIADTPLPVPEQQESIKQYTVRQGDTLYRIAEDYGLTVGDLISANQELRWGLKPGQVIIIPVADLYALNTSMPYTDSAVQVTQQHILSAYQCDSIVSLKRVSPLAKVAILLPFYAQENFLDDTLSLSDTIPEIGSKTDRMSFKGRAAVELYEGFLLAVDTLKRLETNIGLYVYDTESDTNKVKKILKELEIIEPDLIFGPIATENLHLVSKFAFERKIPFVPPLAADDPVLSYNPFLIQTIPAHDEELNEYTRYIAQFYSKNIILTTKPGLQYQHENSRFKELLASQAKTLYGIDSLNIAEVTLDDDVKKNINLLLQKDRDNLVIILSTYEPDVINVLSHLHFMLRDDYSIQVFGLPQWQRFDNVRVEVMHELQVTLYSSFFIDYTNPMVESFVRTCRNKLKYEPFKTTAKGSGINYTFLGYDLGIYFLEALNSYHKNLCDCIPYKKTKLLLSDYNYKRDESLGYFVNKHISIIRYNKEYEVEVMN